MFARYKVEGREFADGDAAEMFARQIALATGRNIPVMEKLDEGTPWHVCCTITDET